MGTTDNIPSFPLLILLRTHTHLLPPTPRRDLTSPTPTPTFFLPHLIVTSHPPSRPYPHPTLPSLHVHTTSLPCISSLNIPSSLSHTLLPLTHPKHFSPSLTPNSSPPHTHPPPSPSIPQTCSSHFLNPLPPTSFPPTSLPPSSTPSLHTQQNVPNQSSPRCPECYAQQQHTVAQELPPQWDCWP